MKKLFLLMSLVCEFAYGAANDMVFTKRNPENTGQNAVVYSSPASIGFLVYDPAIPNVSYVTLGSNLSITGGILSSSGGGAQVNADWSSSSGLSQILNKPSLFDGTWTSLTGKPTVVSVFTNDAAYVTSSSLSTALGSYATTSALTTGLAGKETAGAASTAQAFSIQRSNHTGTQAISTVTGLQTALDGKDASGAASTAQAYAVQRANHTGTQSAGTITGLATVATSGSYPDLSNKPTIGKAFAETTQKAGAFPIFKSATVASGVAVFHLTADGLSTGTALCTEVLSDSVAVIVNDATASYQMAWAFSNSNKTLTVTANKLTTANILTGLLGQAAANGSVVKLSVFCA